MTGPLSNPQTNIVTGLVVGGQVKTNTRFSAAALVTHYPRLGSSEIGFKFYFVPSPFARFPVSKEFERLFSASSED